MEGWPCQTSLLSCSDRNTRLDNTGKYAPVVFLDFTKGGLLRSITNSAQLEARHWKGQTVLRGIQKISDAAIRCPRSPTTGIGSTWAGACRERITGPTRATAPHCPHPKIPDMAPDTAPACPQPHPMRAPYPRRPQDCWAVTTQGWGPSQSHRTGAEAWSTTPL